MGGFFIAQKRRRPNAQTLDRPRYPCRLDGAGAQSPVFRFRYGMSRIVNRGRPMQEKARHGDSGHRCQPFESATIDESGRTRGKTISCFRIRQRRRTNTVTAVNAAPTRNPPPAQAIRCARASSIAF